MPIPLAAAIVGGALQAIPAIGGLLGGGRQRRAAAKIKPINATYEESPYAKALYGAGANLYKGRMAGATGAENNIYQNAANTNALVSRNAGDASTALAMAAGIQGQANDAFGKLAIAESGDKLNRFGVYSDVTRQMTAERDKVFQDKLRKYYDDLNYKRALEGAAMQNTQMGLNNIGQLGQSVITLGLNGAFGEGNGGRRGDRGYGRNISGQQTSNIPRINTGYTPATAFTPITIPSMPNNIASHYVWQRPQTNYNTWGNP